MADVMKDAKRWLVEGHVDSGRDLAEGHRIVGNLLAEIERLRAPVDPPEEQCSCAPFHTGHYEPECPIHGEHPPERVSEASALLELDDHVGLHEGIEIAYLVDRYEATLTTHDGASTKATCEGETVIAALVALRRALEDTKGTDED